MDYASETDNPSSKSVKIDGKQLDKARRIVHQKLSPFHFQIKTYCVYDTNSPTDNPSLVWETAITRRKHVKSNEVKENENQ